MLFYYFCSFSVENYAQSYVVIQPRFWFPTEKTCNPSTYTLQSLENRTFVDVIPLTKEEVDILIAPSNHNGFYTEYVTCSDGIVRRGESFENRLFSRSRDAAFPGSSDLYPKIRAVHLLPMGQPQLQKVDSVPNGAFCSGDIVILEAEKVTNFYYYYKHVSSQYDAADINEAGNRYHKWQYRTSVHGSWIDISQALVVENTDAKTTLQFSLESLGVSVTANTDIEFRVISNSSSIGSINSVYSELLSLEFMSPAPVVNGYANGSQLPNGSASCCNADNPTGVISLGSVTSIGQVRYVLRMGYDKDSIGNCNITQGTTEQIKSCLSDVECSGVLGGDGKITNVPPGEYTLLIANDGGSAGACYTSYNVKIPPIEPLTLLATTPTPESCPGANDGKVRFQFSGGLLPITINGVPYNTRDITIENLAPNAYTTWTATDGCHVSP